MQNNTIGFVGSVLKKANGYLGDLFQNATNTYVNEKAKQRANAREIGKYKAPTSYLTNRIENVSSLNVYLDTSNLEENLKNSLIDEIQKIDHVTLIDQHPENTEPFLKIRFGNHGYIIEADHIVSGQQATIQISLPYVKNDLNNQLQDFIVMVQNGRSFLELPVKTSVERIYYEQALLKQKGYGEIPFKKVEEFYVGEVKTKNELYTFVLTNQYPLQEPQIFIGEECKELPIIENSWNEYCSLWEVVDQFENLKEEKQ